VVLKLVPHVDENGVKWQ